MKNLVAPVFLVLAPFVIGAPLLFSSCYGKSLRTATCEKLCAAKGALHDLDCPHVEDAKCACLFELPAVRVEIVAPDGGR